MPPETLDYKNARFIRIVEVGCPPSGQQVEKIRDDLTFRFDQLCERHAFAGNKLDLVTFGTVDLVSIQEVSDLTNLGVAATYESTRFQRASGAWSEQGNWPEVDPARPYFAICYLKFNPLADIIAGHELGKAITKYIREHEHSDFSNTWPLRGLDTAQIIVVKSAASLGELEMFAWRLRKLTLGTLAINGSDGLDGLGPYLGSPPSIGAVRALSWSHTLVGVPVSIVRGEGPDLVEPDFQQPVILRTRYRVLPGGEPPANLPTARSIFGNHDLVLADEQPTNTKIVENLKVIWREGRGYLIETEIEFLPRPADSEDPEPIEPDPATASFCKALLSTPIDVRDVTAIVRPKSSLSDTTQPATRQKWSYQRTNGAVNLLLAYNQRFADPFDLGQSWRLREPLAFWLEKIKYCDPQDEGLTRWTKHLERAIRLDDDQEDPSYRPSLPLSFASRGGYVALREAFVAYLEESIEARMPDKMVKCALTVDSVEVQLKTKPLEDKYDAFILLVSGFQIQAMPLWPYIIHEIEHIYLHQLQFMASDEMTEALCDRALIDSGIYGTGVDALERVASLTALGTRADFLERWPVSDTENTSIADKIAFPPLRLAYLWMLTIHESPWPDRSARGLLTQAMATPWWRFWSMAICGYPSTAIQSMLEGNTEKLDELMTKTTELFAKQLDSRHVNQLDKRPSSIEAMPCARVIGPLMECVAKWSGRTSRLGEWDGSRGERALELNASMICNALDQLSRPVWAIRRRHILAQLDPPTSPK